MHLIFLEVPPSLKEAYQAAKSLGYTVVLVTTDPEPLSTQQDAICLHVEELEVESILGKIQTTLTGPISLVWTLKDYLIPMAAELNKKLKTRSKSYSAETVWRSKDKWLMREALKDTPYNPNYKLIEADSKCTPRGFSKCVVKPVIGFNSIGVELVENSTGIAEAIKRSSSTLATVYKQSKSVSDEVKQRALNHLLIEEYVGGEEFSLELFAHNGKVQCLAACSKAQMKEPYFEEVSYLMPAHTSKELTEKFEEVCSQVAQQFEIQDGCAHVEVKVEQDRIVILDIGLRIGGGGLTHQLVNTSLGIDLFSATLAQLSGLESDKYLKVKKSSLALLYLYQVREGGTVDSMPDPTHLEGNWQLVCAENFNKKGDQLKGYPHYSGHPGYALFEIAGQNQESYQVSEELIESCEKYLQIKLS